jgi:hypothetical protein
LLNNNGGGGGGDGDGDGDANPIFLSPVTFAKYLCVYIN